MGNSMAVVLPLGAHDAFAGNIGTPGEVDQFQVTIPDDGRLTVAVQTATGGAPDQPLGPRGAGRRLRCPHDGVSPSKPPANAWPVWRGLGAGTFHSDATFPAGNTPCGLVAGISNRDGILALAPANKNADEPVPASPGVAPYAFDVSILLGKGDGTFQP